MRDYYTAWVEALVSTLNDADDSRTDGVSAIPTLTAQVKAQEDATAPLLRTPPMHASPKIAEMRRVEEKRRKLVATYLTRTEIPLSECGYLSARCVMMKPKEESGELPKDLPAVHNRYEILCRGTIIFSSECILEAGTRFENLAKGCNLA